MPDPPSSSADPAKQSKVTKPPKQPKEPKEPTPANDTTPKPKTAKELKKEKRAAAVAARGTTAEDGQPSDPVASSSTLSAESITRARPPLSHGQPSSSAIPTSSPQNQPRKPQPPPSQQPQTPNFFSHLPTHLPPSTPHALKSAKLHPIITRLGVLYSRGTIRGANARTMAMMAAFQEVIRDYECPDQAVLWKDLPVHLSPMISWLEGCRPKGVGGGNAIRWLKGEINRLGEIEGRSEAEQKGYLIDAISVYVRDKIEYADQVIADFAKEKIRSGDVVVTYARSSVVERALLEAWREMREEDAEASFEVIVVDSRPLNEGRALLSSLQTADIPVTYTLLPLLPPLLPRASLVLLGASALHSDGALYARAGTALIAMLAKEARVPVVACVETYKFGERVVLDGVGANEMGDPQGVLKLPGAEGNEEDGKTADGLEGVMGLTLMYDLTPPSLITAVCTEIGFIPPSSVPTVLGKSSGVS